MVSHMIPRCGLDLGAYVDVDGVDLSNPKNVKFTDLLRICRNRFGEPRIVGSHHIFKMPWQGDPRINIQKLGKHAKPYQVKQVISAVTRLARESKRDAK